MARRTQYQEPEYKVKQFQSVEEIENGVHRLSTVLKELKRLQESKTYYRDPGIEAVKDKVINSISAVYGTDSIQYGAFRDFQIMALESYSQDDPDSVFQKMFDDGLQSAIARVQSLIDELEEEKQYLPSLSSNTQMFFGKGRQYDAIKVVSDLIRNALQSIVIIDAYMDESVLDLLTAKGNTVTVKILTFNITPTFKVHAQKFAQQHKNLTMASSTTFHDRFFIIDNKEVYLVGASLKDIASKACMLIPVTVPKVVDDIKQYFVDEWSKATPVI